MSDNEVASGVTVMIPEPLRAYTDGQAEVSVQAGTVGDVLYELVSHYEEIGKRIIGESGGLRHGVIVAVNGQDIRFAGHLQAPVRPGEQVQIVVTMLV